MIYFIGIIVSLLVQWLKGKYGTSSWKTLGILLGVSVIAAGIYTYLSYAGLWEITAQVLVTAGAFYTFVIARFEK